MKRPNPTKAKNNETPLRRSFAKCPPHLFNIPSLSFRSEIENRTLSETWFKLGEWSHGYETNKDGLQLTVMRQTLLIPKGAFESIFNHLESIGNVLHSLGKASGCVFSSGADRKYRYEPFHWFDLRGIETPCEPVVFVHESALPKCLFLNPDLIIYLGLTEKVSGLGVWWDTRTSSEVIRHHRSGNIEVIQIRSDFLRRYLQARQMSLLIGHYAHRHHYNPSPAQVAAFKKGEVILGSPGEHAKALLQNWGLQKNIGEPFLQRRLHLWFEIQSQPINEEDPWGEDPPFNPYTFTFPTINGPVAPARWAHLRAYDGKPRYKGKTCNFMDPIYFRQEALVRYETSGDFHVSDDGAVLCGSHWGLSRSTRRLGNDLLCTSIGDFAEGVPFSEWIHWQMHSVEPPSHETIESMRADKPIPLLINELVHELNQLNSSFVGFAHAINATSAGGPWQGSLDSIAGRQLKWAYPANANEDEFIKRATLASTLVVDALLPEAMRELLCQISSSLHLKEGKSLGSRNLLQRVALVATLITKIRPPLAELTSLVDQTENISKKAIAPDIQIELASVFADIRADFSPIAFLYDLRVHGGIAHPPNKKGAVEAARKLGLPDGAWTRQDFIRLINLVTGSIEKISSRLSDASRVVWNHPAILSDVSQPGA